MKEHPLSSLTRGRVWLSLCPLARLASAGQRAPPSLGLGGNSAAEVLRLNRSPGPSRVLAGVNLQALLKSFVEILGTNCKHIHFMCRNKRGEH